MVNCEERKNWFSFFFNLEKVKKILSCFLSKFESLRMKKVRQIEKKANQSVKKSTSDHLSFLSVQHVHFSCFICCNAPPWFARGGTCDNTKTYSLVSDRRLICSDFFYILSNSLFLSPFSFRLSSPIQNMEHRVLLAKKWWFQCIDQSQRHDQYTSLRLGCCHRYFAGGQVRLCLIH